MVPSVVERWLVDVLVPGGLAALVAAEEHGLLTVSPAAVAFRHELTRRAVADALPVARRVELNRRVLPALVGRGGRRPVAHRPPRGPGRRQRRDRAATGRRPARDAAAAGAHREAAAHYRLVLESPGAVRPRPSWPSCWRGTPSSATRSGPPRPCSPPSARPSSCAGHRATSARSGRTCAGCPGCLVGRRPGGRRAGRARRRSPCWRRPATAGCSPWPSATSPSCTCWPTGPSDCVAVGERAIALARELGDAAILSHALTNVGSVRRWPLGDPVGWSLMEESLRVALAAGEVEHACRAYVHHHLGPSRRLSVWTRPSGSWRRACASPSSPTTSAILGYLQVELGRLRLARAAWDEAVRAAERGLSDLPYQRCPALVVLGRCGCVGASRAATSCCAKPRRWRWSWGSCNGPGRWPRPGPRRPGWPATTPPCGPSPARPTRRPAVWATPRSRPSWATG